MKKNRIIWIVAIIVIAFIVWSLVGGKKWTLNLFRNGAVLMRLEYASKDECMSAGGSYVADKTGSNFECGYKCGPHADITQSMNCEQVCNIGGCR